MESPQAEDDASESTDDLVFPPEIYERIPEDERAEFSRKLVGFGFQITRESHFSSNLPSYEQAAGWNALVPGTAERIFNRYEKLEINKIEASNIILGIAQERFHNDSEFDRKQHDDSVTLAMTELNENAKEVKQGQWFAFLSFIFVSFGGFYMVHLGHDAIGIAILVFEAVGVAGVFLHQFRSANDSASLVNRSRNSSPADSDG